MNRCIMKKLNFFRMIIISLILFSIGAVFTSRSEAQQVPAHVGTDFWLAFPQQTDPNAFADFELDIQSDQTANYTITALNPASTVTGTVGPTTPKRVIMNRFIQIITNQVIDNRGVHITSNNPISVIFKSPSVASIHTDEAYLALPTPTLGKEYIVVGYQEDLSQRGFLPTAYPSELVVLATENGTNVVMNTSCTSLSGTPAGGTVVLAMNAGQTYQYQCGNKQDVTGTIVTSDKPVAVYGGSRCADIPAGTAACDYLVEQMFPVKMWRNDYLTYPLNDGTDDLLRIVASRDGTGVTIDDGFSPQTVTINRGKLFDLTTGRATHITSTQPILVAQYIRGGDALPKNPNRDPSEILIIPTDLFLTGYRLTTPTGYLPNYLNIIVLSSAVSSVRLDGNPVSGFTALPGGTYMGTAVQVNAGQHVVTASAPIAVYSYGYAASTSYGYPGGIAVARTFNTVRAIDTVSTANINLDQTTFSKPPASVTPDPVHHQTVIEWDFASFDIGQIEDLSFDVVLKNPVPGEDRLVHHKLELVYNDINGNPVRVDLGPQTVHVATTAVTTMVATDMAQYNPNSPVNATLSVTNLSDFARSFNGVVQVEDGAGNFVAVLSTLSGLGFAAGQTQTFAGLIFNTGTTLAGNYRVHAQLTDASAPSLGVVGDAAAPFVIQAIKSLTSALVTDRLQYDANQTATLTAALASGSINAVLSGLNATVTITDPTGAVVFSQAQNVSSLLPQAFFSFKAFWNTGISAPGAYTAHLAVTTADGLMATSSAGFIVASSVDEAKALAGTITVAPGTVIEGEVTQFAYTVQNIGNTIDVPGLTLQILIVDPSTQQAVRTLIDLALANGLNNREQFANGMSFNSRPLAPATYLVILQAIVGPTTQTLAQTTLVIQPNPAPTANAGPNQIGFIGQAVTFDGSASLDTDGDPLTFQWAVLSVPTGSQITTAGLGGATTAHPSFVPDMPGTYILTLVVNDGFQNSQTAQAQAFIEPPVQVDLHPETINLKSNGGSTSVTVVLFSPVLGSFIPFTGPDGVTVTAVFSFTHTYSDKNGKTVSFTTPTTDYPEAHTVMAVDLDGNGTIDGYQLTLKIDRQQIIKGFTDSTGKLTITQPTPLTSTAFGNGFLIGSDINTAIAPPK